MLEVLRRGFERAHTHYRPFSAMTRLVAALALAVQFNLVAEQLLSVVSTMLLVAASACAPPTTPIAEPTPPSGEPTPTAAPLAPSPTAAIEEEPLVFTYSVPLEIPNIDPAIVADWPGGVAVRAPYDPLLRARGDPVEMEPWLAESYDASEDGTEYTFHMRHDAVFHDGSPVTADAVAYSYERFAALQSGYSWMFTDVVRNVTVVDDRTVRFTLTEPFGPFVSTLGYFYIVNPAVVRAHEKDGDWGSAWMLDHKAGSGPCTISRFEPGVMYEFAANPDYWAGWPHETNPDYFRYMVMREPGAAKLALDAAETDWLIMADEEDVKYFEGKEGFTVELRSSLEKVFIYVNTASGVSVPGYLT